MRRLQPCTFRPKSEFAYNNRGNVYRKQGDYQQAIADYTKAIELDPKYTIAYNNRGLVYADQGDHQRAITDHNKAIELNPKYAAAYYSWGLAYYKQSDCQRAMADFNRATELNPGDAASWNRICRTGSLMGAIDVVVMDACDLAIQLASDDGGYMTAGDWPAPWIEITRGRLRIFGSIQNPFDEATLEELRQE